MRTLTFKRFSYYLRSGLFCLLRGLLLRQALHHYAARCWTSPALRWSGPRLGSTPPNWRSVSTVSNDTGQYEFLSLKPGSYEITVEAANFRKYEQRNVQLLVNNPTTLNVTLKWAQIPETVKCPRKRRP